MSEETKVETQSEFIKSYFSVGKSSCLTKEYKIFEQEDLTQALFALSLPN